jgi:adenylate cyclase, class 1
MPKLINNLPIDTQNIEDGLDRKQLVFIKQRFLQINQIRFERSCQALTERQQHFLTLLPLLFHVNHPMLPGYISNQVPYGVAHYSPQKNELQLAKVYARSFHYQKDISVKNAAIDALFVMGSPGTIAQTDSSDLDLWVCYRNDLTLQQRDLLQQKSDALIIWTKKNIHLTAHCYLMQSDAFKEEKKLAFNSEASGTAQYYLLLDEFYRTALWLAGKVPLWWFVPAEREADYDHYVETLIQKRFLKKADVIDFGGVAKIPPEEYLGAGIWQLYKAIESPYKSVLKLLLLEIYATQENTPLAQPLALKFKQAVYSGITHADQLDPYIFIYQRIEEYLIAKDNPERLELIRQCFYFKVNRSISKENRISWQADLLRSMVSQWSWALSKLQQLDNRSAWKMNWVLAEHRLLVNELSHCYQLLNDLHKRLGLQASISREQLTILGRKLYAEFERRAGKVHLVISDISRDLTEKELFFIQSNANGKSWLLQTESQDATPTHQNTLKHSPQLIELLVWSLANGLVSNSTKLHFISNSFTANFSHRQLLDSIVHWLPEKTIDIDNQAFNAPAYITQFLLIANLGHETQTELQKKGLHLISDRNDALGFSGFRENLVQSLDCIYVNSWGEIICRSFEKDALVQFMQYYLQLISRQNFLFPEIRFRCFNSGRGNMIASRLEELWKQFHYCFIGSGENKPRFLFEAGEQYFLIESPLTCQEPIYRTSQLSHLLEKLSAPNHAGSKLFIDPLALTNTPIQRINQLYSPKAIQLFYYIQPQAADIYLLDDKGALFYYSSRYHSTPSLLRPLCFFLQNLINKLEFVTNVVNTAPKLLCFEIHKKHRFINSEQSDWILEPRKIEGDLRHLPLFNIKVIAETLDNDHPQYLIYCNEQEFSSYLYGDRIFEQVAAYIKSQRKDQEPYPCYITDLDISRHHSFTSEFTLIEFWRMKMVLEEKINTAYRSLHSTHHT